MIDRRMILAGGAGLALSAAMGRPASSAEKAFPKGFIWGAATSGHQTEGNNTNSDTWFMESVSPSAFAEPSGDATNSFALWRDDFDLVKAMGLNAYRFSIEWARIEPSPGLFSRAMLDHYRAMIEGCRERGLTPIVTFNHFTAPRWFAAMGGWTNSDSPRLFARFCDKAATHLAEGIGYAVTFNEPNIMPLLRAVGLPQPVLDKQRAMLAEAARRSGAEKFVALNVANTEDWDVMQANLLEAHKAARDAIKAVRPSLPVGLSLALFDDQAFGENSLRDAKRQELYGPFLDLARNDDFFGVQNYERAVWTDKGKLPPPSGATLNFMGGEVYAPSLAGAVRYAHEMTKVPILVTEHGVGTEDDRIRAELIPAALASLQKTMDEGVPVIGYCHWSLLDNFEWIFGFRPKYGLHTVDRVTFKREAKPSAAVLGGIARRNAL